jgi:signal transduction histidine kinase
MTLKRRVTLALSALVALFVIVQGVLAYLSLEEQEDDLVDQLVLTEAQALATRAARGELDGERADELLDPGPSLSAWLVRPDGSARPQPLPEYLQPLGDGPHRPGRPERHLHVVVQTTAAGRLYVQYDAEQNEEKVRQFGYYLIGLGAICIAFGIVLSWRVAGWVVAPIERLTVRLADWAPEATATDGPGTDEESRLLGAFSRVQGRFERAIAREREFVANVGHEVRTPLAGLRTDLEMLQALTAADAPQRGRIDRALAAVDSITDALATAASVARREPSNARPVDLARCVDDAWASLESLPGIEQLRFANEVPHASWVRADRHALLTILRNLIRNAVEHAAPARCVVRLTAHGIEVIDDGPGIAAADLPYVFDRYFRGRRVDSPGVPADGERGLGLAIARQVADQNGWALNVEPASFDGTGFGRGTRFVLALQRD